MDRMHTNALEMSAASYLDEYLTGILNNKPENDIIINPLCNLLIRFLISKYLILTLKEEIITKPKNSTYDNTLLFSNIDKIAQAISDKKDDNIYSMNGRVFSDPNSVIAYVRNKLAHGDYTLSDDYRNIIFAPDGDQVTLDIMRIEYLAAAIAEVFGEYRSSKEYTRGICAIQNHKPINKLFKKATDQDLNEILHGMRIIRFDLKSKEDTISKHDFMVFDNILDTIKATSVPFVKESVEKYNKLIREITLNGSFNSTLDISLMELSVEERDYIRRVFRSIYGEDITYCDSLDLLGNLAERTMISKYNNFYTNLEAFKMLRVMQTAFQTQTSDFNKISDSMSFIGKLFCTGKFSVNYDWVALSQLFKLMNLSNFFENQNVDFDIFETFDIKPKTFIIKDNRETDLLQQIEAISNKISKNKLLLEEKRLQIVNLEASTMNEEVKEKIIADVRDLIKQIEATKKANIKEIKKYRSDLDKLQKDKKNNMKYYYNKYLLEYIRNSICHGNVDIIPAGTIGETIIRFRDYDKDETVFEYDVTVNEINSLIKANTFKIEVLEIVNSINKKQL